MLIDVLIVSTSRFQKYGSVNDPTQADDLSGNTILEMLRNAGCDYNYHLLPDGIETIKEAVMEIVDDDIETIKIRGKKSKADAIVICGGTGLAPKDLTLEAIEPLLDKQIPGFGEIFRLKSLDEVGTRAILTRASAGVIHSVPIFCLPGSPSAARLGMELILAELKHILYHLYE